MPKYFIPVTWEQTAYHIIEAESLEQAQELGCDFSTPTLCGDDLDALPPPWQELDNNEYAISHADIREATPDEISRAEIGSVRHDNREKLLALVERVASWDKVAGQGFEKTLEQFGTEAASLLAATAAESEE